MIFAMSFPNIIGLYVMARELKEDTNSFMNRIRSGAIKKFR
jgi:AGCS family alanine or glycine:cation symporter